MAEETFHMLEAGKGSRKRRLGHKKHSKGKKKQKVFLGSKEQIKTYDRMKRLFKKRAREYNSDDEDEIGPADSDKNLENLVEEEVPYLSFNEQIRDDGQNNGEESDISDAENDEIQPGITKFTEGCRAFRMAFRKITKKNVADDSLGPILSGHKKLVAEKLAEEQKLKGEARKDKQALDEMGHAKPANFMDSHEKFLVGVATKGVVKLFNAVNKAQNAQKGLNSLRSKDAKALRKHKKEAFFSELAKTTSTSTDTLVKSEGPAWAPLRDNYMLTNSKLKDWDKMPDTNVADDIGKVPLGSSSDDD